MGEISRKHIPMFRYALLLSTGIFLSHSVEIPYWIGYTTGILAFVYTIYQVRNSGTNYKSHLFVSICIVLISLGMVREQLWEEKTSTAVKKLRITSFPQKQSFQIQFEATDISSFHLFDAETFLVTCKDTALNLHYGDVFITHKQASAIEVSPLPFEFNYQTFLFGNGITQKIELCSVDTLNEPGLASGWYSWINASRNQFKRSTSIIFKSSAAKGLAESLLLGYKENLDRETKDNFLRSGVSHLLAVSGMHTALIYEALFLLFLPFGRSQKHRLIFLATALFILTYFTLLSGCSASVLRSSIMCSMFAIGYAFRKKGSGLNTLGTSIVVILWFSPYQLWNLGFQLSVCAVIGILTIHQFLSNLFSIQHKIYKYLFEAVSITVCAQITTLPIILYHFHSFPLYFIPANIILIPISTIALFASMFCIFLVGIQIHIDWIFRCTEWLVELFASCADLIASLPNSMIQPISITVIEAILIVGIISYYIVQPFILTKKIVLGGLLICIGWTSIRIYNERTEEHKMQQLFISNSKKSGYLMIDGLHATIINQKKLSDFDYGKIKTHYNLTELTTIQTPENASGILFRSNTDTHAWFYKKNCTSIDIPVSTLFSYKLIDSTYLHPENHIFLQVKNITDIK